MKKFLKFVLIAFVAFVVLFGVLLAAAAVIIPRKFPPEKLKAMATENLSKTLKRPVSVGKVEFHLLEGFRVGDLKIANGPSWQSGNFVAAKEIAVSYRLFPLLWGQVALGEIKLDRPQILVERKADGKFNFSDMMEEDPKKAAKGTPAPAKKKEGGGKGDGKSSLTVTVDKVTIDHAKLAYLDRSSGRLERTELKDLNLSVGNISMTGGKMAFSLQTPFDYEKTAYQIGLKGSLRYFPKTQSLQDLDLKGDVNGVGFVFTGSAKDLAENFSPDIKGSASLEMIKTIGLIPKSLASMPEGLELSGPANLVFHVTGSLKGGLELAATAEGSGMFIRYKDLFLKETKTPMKVEFKSVKKGASYRVPSFHAVFQDWTADGSFIYAAKDSYSFAMKSKSMPLKGLSEAVPRWKRINFGGAVGLDLSASQKLGNARSLKLNGTFGFKDVTIVHPHAPRFLENFNGGVAMTESSIRIPSVSFSLMGSAASAAFAMTRFHLSELSNPSKLNADVAYNLRTDDIDLEKAIKVFTDSGDGSGGGKAKTAGEGGAKTAADKKAAPKDANWSVGPGLTVNGNMAFKSFYYRKLDFKNVAVTTALAKQVAQNRATVDGFGGKGGAALNVGLGGRTPTFSFAVDLKGVQAEKAVNDTVDSMDNKEWQGFKDKYFGTMDFDFKGTAVGTATDTLLRGLAGSGACTLVNGKIKGYAAIKTLNKLFKDKSDEVKFETVYGKLSVKDRRLSFTADTVGKVGVMKAAGGLDILTWVYKPDMRIRCDVKKEYLDSDEVQKVLPKWIPIKTFSDAKGNVPLDIKFTGSAKENNYAWDWERFGKNATGNVLQDLFGKPKKEEPKPKPKPTETGGPAPAEGSPETQGLAPQPTPKPKKKKTDQQKAEEAGKKLLQGIFGK